MDENLNNRPRRYTRREDYSEMLLAENGICRCVAVISAEASEKVRAAARADSLLYESAVHGP